MARRSTPHVRDAAGRYTDQAFARSGSRGMRYSQRSLLSRFADAVKDCQVGSLTPAKCEDFFYAPGGLADSCARSTLGKYRNDLKGFLGWCHRRGWCDSPDFLLGGVHDKSTRAKRQRLRLTEADLWALADAATDPRDRCLFVFVMHTAVRISEALHLRLNDLRLDAGQVRLRILKTREEDVFNIPPSLDRELRVWLRHYASAASLPSDAFLFPARLAPAWEGRSLVTDRGYVPENKINNPRLIIRRLAETAGVELEDGDGWHTIRRSVARLFFDNASERGHDAALRMTSALLHHANTQTTENYLGLALERVKRDEIMAAGFLSDPRESEAIRLDDYRRANNGENGK